MDGEHNGKPYLKWMIWGYHYFSETSKIRSVFFLRGTQWFMHVPIFLVVQCQIYVVSNDGRIEVVGF